MLYKKKACSDGENPTKKFNFLVTLNTLKSVGASVLKESIETIKVNFYKTVVIFDCLQLKI